MIINQSNLIGVFTSFVTLFSRAFAGAPSQYRAISTVVPSTTREENYAWLGEFPRLREWVGDRVINNLSTRSYIIKNRKFEDTVAVSRDDIADDRVGVYSPFLEEMGRAAAMHPDELVFALLGTGFTAKAYDGQNFFDTDHPVLDATGTAQSVSNTQAGAGTPWYLIDASRAVKPFIFQTREPYELQHMDKPTDENVFMRDEFLYGVRARVNVGFGLWQLAFGSKATLDKTNYEAAREALMTMKGDFGKVLGVKPTHLVVPPELEGEGRRILKAATGDAGASNEWFESAELIVSEFLS